MSAEKLYEVIAQSIRSDIRSSKLRPGDALPTVRDAAVNWACAPGTVTRAYRLLADEGVIVSRGGQGSFVAESADAHRGTHTLRLVNRVEAVLLDLMDSGYRLPELSSAVHMALDQIRAKQRQQLQANQRMPRFVGSHDPALSLATSLIANRYPMDLEFAGSLNGLLALAQGQAEIAGCHLWDSETATYNLPYIQRLLHGRALALITIAHRHLGLITHAANPLCVQSLDDLNRPDVRFINRQPGAGTRIWLESQLGAFGISGSNILGYDRTVYTHMEVAQSIVRGEADIGLGVEAAALAYGLHFVPLTTERYDVVIPAEFLGNEAIEALIQHLLADTTRHAIDALGGYETAETGRLMWVA